MTDYKMTDEMRKKLTELLGECWHEWELMGSGNYRCKYCVYVPFRDFFPRRRTFTTDTDRQDVFRKMQELGRWDEFYEYAWGISPHGRHSHHNAWLFLDNPERACCLAAMFLEEQG